MNRISEHISYQEATKSITAIRNGVRNAPNPVQIANMKRLAEAIFEPLRKHFGVPIWVSSFFRSFKLNQLVGGSKSSQHLATRGAAIDLDDVLGGVTNAMIFHYIKDNLDFDQLIWEFGDNKNPDWVHVSYVSQFQNRGIVLQAIRFTDRGGKKKTKYIPYE